MSAESIFDLEDTSSLFEEVTTEETNEQGSKDIPTNGSLFDIEQDDDDENLSNLEGILNNAEDPEEEEDDDDPKKPKPAKKPKTKSGEKDESTTSYGEAIQALIKDTEDFLIYEGEEERTNYSKEEFVELLNANIDTKVNKYVESTLTNIVDSFSPSIQKIIKAELKGVKVKDIIDDIREYEEVSNIPENPSDNEKELLVKKYYKELAKEKNKSDDWVSKTVERIIDTDDLDSEYEDAAEHYEAKIQEKIEQKAKEKEREKENTIKFKQHHSYVVNEILKENELFGIKLKKQDKDLIGDVLAGFVTRTSDQKEKMKLTAIIDQLINDKKDQKTSYKKLALMALAAANPEGMISSLSNKAETAVTQAAVKQLKVADKNVASFNPKAKQTVKKLESFFGK
jgi:hypothetical protein